MRAPDFWGPGDGSPIGRLLAAALAPAGWLYGTVTTARAGREPVWRAPVPVICVGNAVMGGAGKTQVCLDLCRRLSGPAHAVHVLSRGYGGRLEGPVRVDADLHRAAEVGDEALVLARHAPTWIGADRTATARAAADAGAGLIVMDDGFQNPDLRKNANLLVIDGGYGFGNGRVFPAGPLRETADSAFARADAAVIIGKPGSGMPDIPAHIPVFRAAIKPDSCAEPVAGKKIIAFAGIGRPEKFFETLYEAGADIRRTLSYPDHYNFLDHELECLLQEAEDIGAAVVTTEKDHARLNEDLRRRIVPFPVELAWEDDDAWQSFILGGTGLK